MIYEEIRNYLVQSSSPETVEKFDKAIELFEKVDFEGHLDRFDQVVGENSSLGDDAVVYGLTTALDDILIAMLQAHGVLASEDASTSDLLYVFDGLVNIVEWEERETIRRILDLESNPEEIFAELLAARAGGSVEAVLASLEEVNPSLFVTLRGVIGEENDVNNTDYSKVMGVIHDYQNAKRVFDIPSCFLDALTCSAETVGMPFRTYFDRFLISVHPYLDDADSENLMRSFAQELVLCGILSEEGVGRTREKVSEYMNELYSDINLASKLDSLLTDNLIKVHRA